MCGARHYLPTHLVPLALRMETSTDRAAIESDVERQLRCTLQAHDDDPHYALVMELDGPDTGSVWTSWAAGNSPELLVVLPDCSGADGRPCTEFDQHPGAHSPHIHDPWQDVSSALEPTKSPSRKGPTMPTTDDDDDDLLGDIGQLGGAINAARDESLDSDLRAMAADAVEKGTDGLNQHRPS